MDTCCVVSLEDPSSSRAGVGESVQVGLGPVVWHISPGKDVEQGKSKHGSTLIQTPPQQIKQKMKCQHDMQIYLK